MLSNLSKVLADPGVPRAEKKAEKGKGVSDGLEIGQ
jgi:hypothetical protein